MADVTTSALEFVRIYGPLALLLFTFLETSMIFPLLPSEVVVPAAAALLITDGVSFLVFVGAAGIGGTAGALVPYYVFRNSRIGQPGWLDRYIRVSEGRLRATQEWFRRWGQSSVLWGRLLPVLRSAVSIPAGFANMNPLRFGLYTAIGTIVFYASSGALVYYARQRSLFQAAYTHATDRPGIVIAGVTVLLVAGLLFWQHARSENVRG